MNKSPIKKPKSKPSFEGKTLKKQNPEIASPEGQDQGAPRLLGNYILDSMRL